MNAQFIRTGWYRGDPGGILSPHPTPTAVLEASRSALPLPLFSVWHLRRTLGCPLFSLPGGIRGELARPHPAFSLEKALRHHRSAQALKAKYSDHGLFLWWLISVPRFVRAAMMDSGVGFFGRFTGGDWDSLYFTLKP